MGLSTAGPRSWGHGVGTHQEVDGAAHAVGFVLVVHNRPVVEEPLQEPRYQCHKVLPRLGQLRVTPAAAEQAGEQRRRWVWLRAQLRNAPA